jgi:glycogen debranching enzyme
MKSLHLFRSVAALLLAVTPIALHPQSFAPVPAFPLDTDSAASKLAISRPIQCVQPFTVAGQRGVILGTQDGQFESWVLPVKLLSHLNIEAHIDGYSVPIPVNQQAAQIDVRPHHTTITYAHIGFTIRQIMYSPDLASLPAGTGPVVLFQIESIHPLDLTFRFTPEMRWMWPKRNDGIPGPEWVRTPPPTATTAGVPPVSTLRPGTADPNTGYYLLHMDYPDLAGAVTIPGAEPGILAPYQERPQVHQLELILHYDPKRDRDKYFPLLMAVGATPASAQSAALGQTLAALNTHLADSYAAHAKSWADLLDNSTSIDTPDKALNDAFSWGVVSIEQLKAKAYPTGETALVAGYYASGDSARPGFGWFFGRDSLYTLYAVNGFGDFALTRDELNFLIARQRADGKIMHEYSQTAAEPVVDWKSFPYMYAAADSTPLFLMAMRDYLISSGDLAYIQANRAAIEHAWAFETAATSDTDHDGIYDNSQGTGWVESWPASTASKGMPHQEVYLAALDQQASEAYAALELALGNKAEYIAARVRAGNIQSTIEKEYADPAKGCYAFSHNPDGSQDKTTTVYPAVAWWDAPTPNPEASEKSGLVKGHDFSRANQPALKDGALAPEGNSPLTHAADCLRQFASPGLATDWGLRDVDASEPFFDGMSYHQGSVWPLFTGWAALAEYRGNQPLAGQQMLMQNVDLTWAQDPGAVTELLSGDTYVPFGRSTSHQLWSSAMVITPTLRGLFGISLDASTNTITVSPHLPANWDHAVVRHLHMGDQDLVVSFTRRAGWMTVATARQSDFIHVPTTDVPMTKEDAKPLNIRFQSDAPGAILIRDAKGNIYGLRIPLPPVEVVIPSHELPTPGSRPAQIKILSTKYEKNQLTLSAAGPAGSTSTLLLEPEQVVAKLKLDQASENSGSANLSVVGPHHEPMLLEPMKLDLHFPPGQGWQTLTLTLTW